MKLYLILAIAIIPGFIEAFVILPLHGIYLDKHCTKDDCYKCKRWHCHRPYRYRLALCYKPTTPSIYQKIYRFCSDIKQFFDLARVTGFKFAYRYKTGKAIKGIDFTKVDYKMDFVEWLVHVKNIPFYNFLSVEEWDDLYDQYLEQIYTRYEY